MQELLERKKIGDSIHAFVHRNGGLACRSGSNTFGIYIPHLDNLKDELAENTTRINEKFSSQKISIRMGIYSDDGTPMDMERKFDCARLTCRKLRNSYETCYGFYSAELHSKELHEEQLINDIDRALSEKQFKVYYQPKYSIKYDKPVITSAEALVR